jgi:rhodanese-related sulfurtransferase
MSELAEILFRLEPLNALPAERLHDLVVACRREQLPRNEEVLAGRNLGRESVYLLKGELRLDFADGSIEVIVGGTGAALHPLGKRGPAVRSAKAITNVELASFDDSLLDAVLTWEQLSGSGENDDAAHAPEATGWFTESTFVRVQTLARGLFPALPPNAIDALLARAKRFRVAQGQAVVREGEAAEYYYVIETGRCRITRRVGGTDLLLAELAGGDAFGEDALIDGSPCSATATMITEGVLLRISRADFVQLLKEPLLQRISRPAAELAVKRGGIWVDVRFPAEYAFDKIPGAINLPLNEIRDASRSLDPGKVYVLYCQSGKRSSAAAFLLSQRGYKAFVLDGGLRSQGPPGARG